MTFITAEPPCLNPTPPLLLSCLFLLSPVLLVAGCRRAVGKEISFGPPFLQLQLGRLVVAYTPTHLHFALLKRVASCMTLWWWCNDTVEVECTVIALDYLTLLEQTYLCTLVDRFFCRWVLC